MKNTAANPHLPGRVLVVEDTEPLRRALRKMLMRAGYEVEDAADFDQARALLAAGAFDAVATDIKLPGETGMSLLTLVHRELSRVPVILMTGEPQLDTAIGAVKGGAFSYLTKPFDSDEFLEIVGRAVRSHRFGSDNHNAADFQQLSHGLDAALDAMYMVYQPIVRVGSGEVAGHEALMRSSAAGFASPLAILAAAERLDRLWDVGRRVRGLVAELLASRRARSMMFVNVHPDELLDDQLISREAPLSRFADRVVLEITERQTLEHVHGAGARIAALRELGYRIAVDDLGSGYSSLNCIAALSPDLVKIDQALVRGVEDDVTRSRMIRLLTQLCHGMGATVVAEGIETAAERDRLIELDCDLLQGYLFGHPSRLIADDNDAAFPAVKRSGSVRKKVKPRVVLSRRDRGNSLTSFRGP